MARAGRKRKQGKREPNGRVQRDYANAQAYANQHVVIDARRRHLGLTEKQAKSEDGGHTAGVLHLRKQITEKQLDAADRYAKAYTRIFKLKGWPSPHPKVASYAEMIAGQASGYEPDAEEIARAVAQWDGAHTAIVDSLGIKEALPAIQDLKTFIIHQAHPDECTPRREMALTAGLDVLVDYYGV